VKTKVALLLLIFNIKLLLAEDTGELILKQNDVFVVRNFETLEASQGYKLISKDIIVTGDQSKAKIQFADNTIIVVGKNSIFEIEEYKYNKSDDSVATFKAKHGFFSAVTGNIGKISPDKFALKTKTATIGVRGTEFEGEVSPSKESVACTKGSIAVTSKGKTIIVKEGESLEIKEDLFLPDPPAEIGEISLIKGIVFIIRNDNTIIAKNGDKIFSNDKIVTSYNSSAEISLVDKSSLEVLKNSGCLIDFKNGKNVIEVVKGVVEQTKNGNKKIIGVKN
jgi:hypothetical protein